MATKTSFKLVIPSEIRLIDLVHVTAEKLAEVLGFDADEALNVGLAVREAVINAMLHGNKQNPDLQVTISMAADKGRLVTKIVDQGNGFRRDEAPDPTDKENLLRNSGRGLLLMEAFVDSVKFRGLPKGGTEVTMIKRLPQPEAQA